MEHLYLILVCLIINLFFVYKMATNWFYIDYSKFDEQLYNHLKSQVQDTHMVHEDQGPI